MVDPAAFVGREPHFNHGRHDRPEGKKVHRVIATEVDVSPDRAGPQGVHADAGDK